ncbi:MAG: hybrid sensor histidine kinase/response regulator [Elusimicrobiales bacterium]|nr:hybrid sensor histidine kinase/response regulator [Elusimicrobiales bacterium]
MAEIKGHVLLVTSGKELLLEMTPSMSGRGLELLCVPSLKYVAERLAAGDCAAVVADFSWLPPTEREALLALHAQYSKVPLFTLESVASMAPAVTSPLRRLSWPLPMGFPDQVRVIGRPVVLLADQVLFSTGAVQKAFQLAGVQTVSLESAREVPAFLNQQAEARRLAAQVKEPKKGWASLLGGSEEPPPPPPPPTVGNLLVAQFSGAAKEASALDAAIRAAVPEAVCYLVSGVDLVRYAIQALKENQPVAIPRDQSGRVAGILVESSEGSDVRLKARDTERILLLDNFKPALASLGQALQGAGYEVTSTMDGEDALGLCQKGAFHLAVIGATNFAQHSGAELAQKLRERDPDLRIIFMVDQYPLKAALQGVSQVVELGLDDAILKPVEASRLIFSVEKALERRFLLLENARLLKEMQELNRQLAAINGFQKNFFATVAHDVKSPLTAILGYAEVLTKKLQAMPSEGRYAANIQTSAKTLNVLISDLVDLAAIESGKLRVEIGTLNLLAVIQDVYERVKIAAQKRNLNMTLETPPVLPPLAGDDARVGQVVQNLCTNAIQYTKEGGKITIKAEVTPDRVIVSVIDTGIGISKEDLPRVWERFFQTKEAQGMRKAGFGLGLKIAREIVQRHGGEMGIESELGVGSRFFFHIPLKTDAPPPAPPQK